MKKINKTNKKGIKMNKITKKDQKIKTVQFERLCDCGCGALVKVGRRFLQGHDMKLKSALLKAEREKVTKNKKVTTKNKAKR